MRALRWWLLAIILLLSASSSAWAQTLDPMSQPSAQLRFVHGLSGAGAVDIYRGEDKIVAALPAGEATEYRMIETGAQSLSIRAAGAALSEAPLLAQTITLNAGHSYTFVVAPDKNNAPASFLLEDDTAVEAEGRGSLRLVNLALGQPAIGAVADEAAVTALLAYGESSARVPVGKGSPVVTIIDDQGQKLLSTPPIPLQSGAFYTLFVTGSGSNLRPIIVSYPLTSGELPTFERWLPMVPGGATSGESVAPAAAATVVPSSPSGAAPAAVPVTGSSLMASTASLWLMGLGLVLMSAVVGFQWWRSRRA